VEAIVNKLGGIEGVKHFLSGELVVKENECKFKSWRTIRLGTGLKTADDFRRALRDGKFRLSNRTLDILERPAFKVADEETEIDLVKVTVAELGFKDNARRDQIYEKAQKLELELCPAEVGPQLRLQHQDQPNGECILVAMEPIIGSGGYPDVFCVARRDSELWLDSYWGSPSNFWNAEPRWVFCRPRK